MNVTISLAQINVVQGNVEENLQKGEHFISQAARQGSDIICFPEMWTTGFNWEKNRAIVLEQEETIKRIASLAREYSLWINGSILAPNEQGKPANTSILFSPEGRCTGMYRKTHLFSFMHEHEHMVAGDHLCVIDTPWGRTGLSICYDIRFPELFRTYALKRAKVIFSPMAFPNPRREHWKILVRARAIENQLFVVGVNQVGSEDFKEDGAITYFGTSCIIDPWGKTIVEASETSEELLSATIDTAIVDEIRNTMHVMDDRRPELYEL